MAESSIDALLSRMASQTGTNADDWFAVFKARYGMQVAFVAASEATGRREVVTQLFTCVTAVDPIVSAGLVARYADISDATLAVDPALAETGPETCAVVAQHTFGLVDDASTQALRDRAHAAGAALVEDCAHCVGRMARDAQGTPLADVSIHSFGVEKVLPGVYFGGAVWVNPAMPDTRLRDLLRGRLAALPDLDPRIDRATRRYRNQMRVFTRIPHGLSASLRATLARRGLFEPAVSDEERRGRLNYQPSKPGEWVAAQALQALGSLEANEAQRMACVNAYQDAFSLVAGADSALFIPAGVRDCNPVQPLLRYPVFLPDAARADRLIAAVADLGHYATAWPRPLLLPGVLDAQAFGLAQGTSAWPVSERLSAGVVGLPTDIDPTLVPAVAREALAIASS